MTVIANGLVPIQPYKTNVLNIAMGQRYNVIVKVDQVSVAKNFRLRATPQNACSENANQTNVMGMIYYGGSPQRLLPLATALPTAVPFYNKSEAVSLGKNGGSLYRWKLNSTSMHVNWTDSTLWGVYRGHRSWTNTSGVVELPHKNVWTYVVIEMSMSVPHPIHLHGHDVVVLAQESGT
ncbi:hypothetical protein N7522_011964 [Penicillium canescens]|nr:hypothetical protein N7522_011964 [Penicillium canescens]